MKSINLFPSFFQYSSNRPYIIGFVALLFLTISPASANRNPFVLPQGEWIESGLKEDRLTILVIGDQNLVELSRPGVEDKKQYRANVLGSVGFEYTVVVEKLRNSSDKAGSGVQSENKSAGKSDSGQKDSREIAESDLNQNSDAPETEPDYNSIFAGSEVYSILESGKTWFIFNIRERSLRLLQPSGTAAPEVILKRK